MDDEHGAKWKGSYILSSPIPGKERPEGRQSASNFGQEVY